MTTELGMMLLTVCHRNARWLLTRCLTSKMLFGSQCLLADLRAHRQYNKGVDSFEAIGEVSGRIREGLETENEVLYEE